jgi:hypothetical protein
MPPFISGGLSPISRQAIRSVLYLEILVNVGNGLVSVFSPITSLQGMTNISLSSGSDEIQVGLEVNRWFGVMGLVFGGFVLGRVLNNKIQLRPVIEGLLLGDLLYLSSLIPFTLKFGKSPLILAPYLLTLLMFLARMTLLMFEDWESDESYSSSGGAVLLVDDSSVKPKRTSRRKSSATSSSTHFSSASTPAALSTS